MRVDGRLRQKGKRPYLFLGLILLVALLLLHHWVINLNLFPEAWDVHLRDPLDAFKQWSIRHQTTHPIFLYFFDPISSAIDFALRRVETFLLWLPWPVLLGVVFLLAQKAANLRIADRIVTQHQAHDLTGFLARIIALELASTPDNPQQVPERF